MEASNKKLEDHRQELVTTVQERTAELKAANERLEREIQDRKLGAEQLISAKQLADAANAVRGQQARAMSILFDLSRSFAAAENLDAITQHTVTATAALMNSRRVSVMLADETGHNLFVASAIGGADPMP